MVATEVSTAERRGCCSADGGENSLGHVNVDHLSEVNTAERDTGIHVSCKVAQILLAAYLVRVGTSTVTAAEGYAIQVTCFFPTAVVVGTAYGTHIDIVHLAGLKTCKVICGSVVYCNTCAGCRALCEALQTIFKFPLGGIA